MRLICPEKRQGRIYNYPRRKGSNPCVKRNIYEIPNIVNRMIDPRVHALLTSRC